MEDLRLGAFVRAERRRRRLRQIDVAGLAGISRQTVSRLERGRIDRLTVASVRRICRALDTSIQLTPKSRGSDPDRLLDARHARLVQTAIAALGPGWLAVPEYSFNRYGDRGSVDVLAWQPAAEALLLIEAKSELHDVQETLRSMDVKARVLPGIVAGERGWRPRSVASVLLLPAESTARRSVDRLESVFGAALPSRTADVRRWIRLPSGSLRGVWFVADARTRGVIRNPGSPGRIRRTEPASVHAHGAASRAPRGASEAPRPARNGDKAPTTSI